MTVAVIACAPAAVLAKTPTVRVTCEARSCTVDTALPSGTFHLVVRVSGGPAPHVRIKGRKDRALARCPKSRTAYCGDVTSAEATELWFGGAAISVEIRVERGRSLADVDTAHAVTMSLYELGKGFGFEAYALHGEGASRTPPLKKESPPQRIDIASNGNRAPQTPPPKKEPPPQFIGVPVVLPVEPVGASDGGPRAEATGGGTSTIPPVDYIPLPLDDEAYPDLVALGDAAALTCSGIAIGRQWVLTARHCGVATRVVIATDIATLVFEAAVDRVVPDPDPRVDLELLHIARELPVTPHSRRHAADNEPPNSDLRIIGFGISNFASRSGFGVKRAFETAVDGWGCDHGRPRTTGCDPARELVVPATSGHDTCNGDSGGAVLELDEAGDEWRLVAITSRAASRLDSGCGQGGIYVRIDAAAVWIDDVVKGRP